MTPVHEAAVDAVLAGTIEALRAESLDVHSHVVEEGEQRIPKVGLALTGTTAQGRRKVVVTFLDIATAQAMGGIFAQGAAQAIAEAKNPDVRPPDAGGLLIAQPGDVDAVAAAARSLMR